MSDGHFGEALLVLNPKTDAFFFTPHLLTQPPMSPASSSSSGRFQLCSTLLPMRS